MKKTTTPKTTTKKKTLTVKTLPTLPNQPFVFEVLDLVSRQRSKAKKVEVLRKYNEDHLRRILIWNFDETIQSALPPGDVPYADPEDQVSYSGTLSTRLTEEIKEISHWVLVINKDILLFVVNQNIFINFVRVVMMN